MSNLSGLDLWTWCDDRQLLSFSGDLWLAAYPHSRDRPYDCRPTGEHSDAANAHHLPPIPTQFAPRRKPHKTR